MNGTVYCAKGIENEWIVYGRGGLAEEGVTARTFTDFDQAADYALSSAIKTASEWKVGCDHELLMNDAGIVYCTNCERDLGDIDSDA